MPVVKFERNVNPSQATTAVKLSGRQDLVIGGPARFITDDEYAVVAQSIVLSFLTVGDDGYDEAVAEYENTQDEPAVDDLEGLKNKELRSVASDEGVDISGLQSNDDITDAIREHRADVASGTASLPATAVFTPQPTVTAQMAGSSEGSTPAGETV